MEAQKGGKEEVCSHTGTDLKTNEANDNSPAKDCKHSILINALADQPILTTGTVSKHLKKSYPCMWPICSSGGGMELMMKIQSMMYRPDEVGVKTQPIAHAMEAEEFQNHLCEMAKKGCVVHLEIHTFMCRARNYEDSTNNIE